jgi:hypothetical protein
MSQECNSAATHDSREFIYPPGREGAPWFTIQRSAKFLIRVENLSNIPRNRDSLGSNRMGDRFAAYCQPRRFLRQLDLFSAYSRVGLERARLALQKKGFMRVYVAEERSSNLQPRQVFH